MRKSDIKMWTTSLQSEREAAMMYESMAKAEPNEQIASVYRRLAETERRHAAHWEEQFKAAGLPVPEPKYSLRSRVLAWLAKRSGPAAVLPTLVAIEKDAGSEYLGTGNATVDRMAADEQSHARIFRALSTDSGLDGSTVARMEGRHRSTGGNALRAGVLGANDGLLSNLSLVMGVAGANMNSKAILVTGMAGMVAGAISMAMGEWLSVQSSRELYGRQIDVEKQELLTAPDEEKEELALIYQAKGVAPEEAQRLAERLLSDPEHALDTLAREELGIDPDELGGSAWEAAIASFFLFALGAVFPVLPFVFATGTKAVVLSLLFSGVGLFGIGAAITLVTGRGILWAGIRQLLIGFGAAAITYGIGSLVGVHVGG